MSINQLIEKTYVVHAKNGYEYHGKRVIELFKKHQIEFEFMTDGDPSNYTPEMLEKFFVTNILDIYTKNKLSCTVNHLLAYEKIVQNGYKYTLMFEDDPCFLGDFQKKITKIIPEIKSLPAGFIISIENTSLRFPSYFQIKKNKYLYQADTGRATGAYIIDLQGAKNILAYLKSNKTDNPIDWLHTIFIQKNVLKMYWAHPPMIEQGSVNGVLSSTVSTKKSSYSRMLIWNIQKLYKNYFLRFFKQKRIIE